MKIDHIHFFVEDAVFQRNWFVDRLGWTSVKQATLPDQNLEVLRYRDTLFVLSSPRTATSPIAHYLRTYAPGIANIAFQVDDLSAVLNRLNQSVQNISPTVTPTVLAQLEALDGGPDRLTAWATIPGWGSLQHTLVERRSFPSVNLATSGIDHIVLNVPTGDLAAAVSFYQCFLGLQKQQSFNIQTQESGLSSQVLFDPVSRTYFNINQPTSANSQIQIFLDANRGAGIQHIALHSDPIVSTVAALRRRGLSLLSVPLTYYQHLQQRLGACQVTPILKSEWQQIVEQQILLDWQPARPESLLLQIFSQPIFQEPTFFLSLLNGDGQYRDLVREISWPYIKQLKRRCDRKGSPQETPHDPSNAPQRLSLEWYTATVF